MGGMGVEWWPLGLGIRILKTVWSEDTKQIEEI